ncbi:SDR family NAD(P)-dependent oxidoreductase [Amycolatopsis rhabdoformis]|uniref:SDR family NAD(P)-dependent oxidoreductase n=1 Tax=Amycolatopsis rhabdoformis TaxID=1448059 RepID=A0ABZ1I5Y7_9PSEU|nr:SDR family NAD(P)-dependent oxidoreductase [Amycolatopsis rhabdoformis]WSE29782.1 SDR family NAD(P)-dependent oxidoreductase [Amycolatopsis rhabdoformis]
MTSRLEGRTALVTGSTGGIGVAIARVLAAEGAHVLVSGRDTARGEKVAAGLAEAGGRATFLRADLTTGAAVRELAGAAEHAADGALDILVNNAALLSAPKPTGELSDEEIDALLAVNIKAPMLLTGLLAPGMAARGSGAIVNLGSINGLDGMAGSALYSTTKAAVHSLTKSWAAEYGPAGVRVNTIAPGPTLTERFADSAPIRELVATVPSRRASAPEEIAGAVLFLVSDDALNIHGTTLSVDGGYSAVRSVRTA